MTEQPELLPCPFCGGKPRAVLGAVAFLDVEIQCDTCGFSGPNFGAVDEVENPRKSAWGHWNTRPALSPHPPLSPQEGWDEVKPVLEQAREAMRWSYEVCDYPADGNTPQDRAISAIDALLAKLEKEEADGTH